MIPEKVFEDIICKYPELVENGLTLKGRQITLYGRRIDILFEDKYNRKLIIELKAGPIKDEHIGQILSYEGMLLTADDPTLRIMLVGTRVPPNLQKSLDHHGIAWKEITYSYLNKYIEEKNDTFYLSFFEKEDPLIKIKTTGINEKINDHLNIDFKLTQIQIEELINKFRSSENYKNFKKIIPQKMTNEERAKTILERNMGNLNHNHLKEIFALVDEPYSFNYDGKLNKGPWFGLLLKPNALTIFKEDENRINNWFNILTNNNIPVDRRFEILKSDRYYIKGLGIGFKTLFLYILEKSKYLIWFQGQHDGLRIVYPKLDKYTGKITQYFEYIDVAKKFAAQCNFEHTELDFILTRFPKLVVQQK